MPPSLAASESSVSFDGMTPSACDDQAGLMKHDGVAGRSGERDAQTAGKGAPDTTTGLDKAGADEKTLTDHFRAWLKRDKYLLVYKAAYYFGMGANGAYYPFIVLRFGSIGIDGFQAGQILASSHVASLLCSPVLARFSDNSEWNRRVCLVGGAAVAAVCFNLMRWASTFWQAMLLQVVAEGALSAVWPIVDASLMACLTATEGNTARYGNSRAWGAAGWGIHAWLAGMAYDRWSMAVMFNVYLLMVLPWFPALILLPVERRGATASSNKTAWRRLATLDVLVFLVVVFITAALLLVVDHYRTPYLSTLGADNTLLGLSITMTSVSETPCFFLASAVLRKVSMPVVLLVVLITYVLRFVWYATLTDPRWTMPMELLHGAQFAFGWAASTQYVASLLPPELSSSAQGLLSAVQWGLGSAAGSLAGGYIFNELGGRALMWYCAALGVCGTAIMLVSMWRTRKQVTHSSGGSSKAEGQGSEAAGKGTTGTSTSTSTLD